MAEYTDWVGSDRAATGLAVLLPGRNYPATKPLLTFAGRVALQHGWLVREMSWDAPELGTEETISWVGDALEGAVGAHEGPVMVIGKSLGTCAAARAAQNGYDAVWLTPLLHLREVVESMTAHPGRQLLIGGSQDPAWDLAVATSISQDVLQVDGADHGMVVDDAVRTAEVHVDVTRAIDQWLTAAGEGRPRRQ